MLPSGIKAPVLPLSEFSLILNSSSIHSAQMDAQRHHALIIFSFFPVRFDQSSFAAVSERAMHSTALAPGVDSFVRP
jgi:hypothetical protein